VKSAVGTWRSRTRQRRDIRLSYSGAAVVAASTSKRSICRSLPRFEFAGTRRPGTGRRRLPFLLDFVGGMHNPEELPIRFGHRREHGSPAELAALHIHMVHFKGRVREGEGPASVFLPGARTSAGRRSPGGSDRRRLATRAALASRPAKSERSESNGSSGGSPSLNRYTSTMGY